MLCSNPQFRKIRSLYNRHFSSLFKEIMSKKIPFWQKKINELREKHGDKVLSKIKLGQVLKGIEGISAMFYTASVVDPKIGVIYRGFSIDEISEYLPKAKDGPFKEGDEPLPESFLWLLITGDFPTPHEYEEIIRELKKRGPLTLDVINYIKELPKEMNPMSQLSSVLLYLQPNSLFQKAVKEGLSESQQWQFVFEDALNLIAQLPQIAAYIYCHIYKNNVFIEPKTELDWAGNFAHMLGVDLYEFREFIRGYLSINANYDGGNVSSKTSFLFGTASTDPYLAYSAAINGLSGAMISKTSIESLKWLMKMKETLGENLNDQTIKDYIITYLTVEQRMIPAYGNSVMTHVDSRFRHQKDFIEKHIKKDPLVSLAQKCYKIVPQLLKSMRNEPNPWPNVEALNGVLFNHYGFKEYEFYVVFDAVSIVLECMANLVISRALQMGRERPISINLEWLDIKFNPKEKENEKPKTKLQ